MNNQSVLVVLEPPSKPPIIGLAMEDNHDNYPASVILYLILDVQSQLIRCLGI